MSLVDLNVDMIQYIVLFFSYFSETSQKRELQTITYILQDNDYYNQWLNVLQNQTINEEAHQNKKNNTVNSKKIGSYVHILIENPKQSQNF
jgi:hypothetical protein